jgi:hypothetical protein
MFVGMSSKCAKATARFFDAAQGKITISENFPGAKNHF